MATKKTNKKSAKPKTRTSSKAVANTNTNFFKWWMVLLLVAVIAVIGIVIVRFSEASYNPNGYVGDYDTVVRIGKGYGWSVRQKDVGFGRYVFYFKSGSASPSVCYGSLGKNAVDKKFGGQNVFTAQANRYKPIDCGSIPSSTYGSSSPA